MICASLSSRSGIAAAPAVLVVLLHPRRARAVSIDEQIRPARYGNFNGHGTPPVPTDARPGSEEKVAVLMSQCRSGRSLWHPDDADLTGPKRRRPELARVG